MQLTTHTDYALRLLIYLAAAPPDTPTTVQEVAQRYGISANHMAKVAQTLVHHGYISSTRGRFGGLKLIGSPEEIVVGHVVRNTENLKLLECFGPDSTCVIDPACRLKHVLGMAQQAFLAVLDDYTLADITANRVELVTLLGIADDRG